MTNGRLCDRSRCVVASNHDDRSLPLLRLAAVFRQLLARPTVVVGYCCQPRTILDHCVRPRRVLAIGCCDVRLENNLLDNETLAPRYLDVFPAVAVGIDRDSPRLPHSAADCRDWPQLRHREPFPTAIVINV